MKYTYVMVGEELTMTANPLVPSVAPCNRDRHRLTFRSSLSCPGKWRREIFKPMSDEKTVTNRASADR
jgi:hypothetical protein